MAKTPNPLETRGRDFLHPKYWGIWLWAGFLKLISLLPYRAKFPVGRLLGKVLYLIGPKRRKIAAANINIAFPDKSDAEKHTLLKAHFANMGLTLIEMSMTWYGDHRKNHATAFERSIVDYKGQENLHSALAQGKGALILGPHFTTLEMTALFISFLTPYRAVYRPNDNALMDHLIAKGRSTVMADGHQNLPISNADTRQMLKTLREGTGMFFLPDQRYRAKGSINVPFFGKECPSNPATSKIAKMTGCAVVPTFTRRIETAQGPRYQVEFLPALENFPSDSPYENTLRLHKLYEQAIQNAPEQYLWLHDRWNIKRQLK